MVVAVLMNHPAPFCVEAPPKRVKVSSYKKTPALAPCVGNSSIARRRSRNIKQVAIPLASEENVVCESFEQCRQRSSATSSRRITCASTAVAAIDNTAMYASTPRLSALTDLASVTKDDLILLLSPHLLRQRTDDAHRPKDELDLIVPRRSHCRSV